ALDALPEVLEVRAPAQQRVLELRALAAKPRQLVLRARVLGGGLARVRLQAAFGALLLLGGRRARGVLRGRLRVVLVAVAALLHARRPRSTSDTARATWSTIDTTCAYCMRVEPSTPTPNAGSPSSEQVAPTSDRSWSSGSGFSWPISTRTPSPAMQ